MQATDKQIHTLSNMTKWVSPKLLHNNGMDKEHIIKIGKNVKSIKVLIQSGYIKRFSADSTILQNMFTFLSNVLDKQTANRMHVIGKDRQPYYQRESFYKRLDEQRAFYQKHGVWRKNS